MSAVRAMYCCIPASLPSQGVSGSRKAIEATVQGRDRSAVPHPSSVLRQRREAHQLRGVLRRRVWQFARRNIECGRHSAARAVERVPKSSGEFGRSRKAVHCAGISLRPERLRYASANTDKCCRSNICHFEMFSNIMTRPTLSSARVTGCINLDELQQTSKMMNFPINKSEANLLVGALGPSVDSRNIPYRDLEDVVLYSRDSPGSELHRTCETAPRTFRASGTFASSRAPLPPVASTELIRTASGHTILPRPLSAPARARSSGMIA